MTDGQFAALMEQLAFLAGCIVGVAPVLGLYLTFRSLVGR